MTPRLADTSAYVFYAGGHDWLSLEGLTFDATGRTHASDSGLPVKPLVASKRQRAANSFLRVRDCTFRGTAGAGVLVFATGADISACRFDTLGSAVYLQDADGVTIADNDISAIAGNGIYLTRSSWGSDGTRIVGNRISSVTQTAPSSTGWEGNGIIVYNAGGVAIDGNRIASTAYSAIRANFCTGTRVVSNTCQGIGETAIYLEALSGGNQLTGGHESVVTANVIDDTATGIALVNFDCNGRLAICSSNLIRSATVEVVSAGTANQASTGGVGIIVEADCNLSSNLIEAAGVFGILPGTNGYTRDLLCNDNLIRATPIGIGFSKESGAGQIFIASNMISGFTNDASHGAIVPVSYTGSGGYA